MIHDFGFPAAKDDRLAWKRALATGDCAFESSAATADQTV
jgi:hypothetical protein